MMFPIDYNGDVLNHNARVGVDGGIVESTDFLADFSEQTKRVNMPLLLDIYPNAAAAYSLRKLRTAYTGSAIRVRRSSDNTETDIGFNNAGDLDTSALATFVGNGNGFVTRWYDQSGGNKHATQTGTTEQPVVVSGGTIVTNNNKAALLFNGISNRLNIPNITFNLNSLSILVLSKNNVADSSGMALSNPDPNRIYVGYTSGSVEYLGYYDSATKFNLGGANTNVSLKSLYSNDTVASAYKNNVLYGSVTSFNVSVNAVDFVIGCYRQGNTFNNFYNGNIQEVILYPTNQSPNRIGIETNINSYYRIYQQEALLLDYYPDAAAAYSLRKLRSGYTGAAIQVRRSSDNAVQNIGFDSNGGLDTTALTTFVGTGNTGFVTTWYDQSLNGNNVIQTGTTEQPVIFSGGTVLTQNSRPSISFDGVNDFLTGGDVLRLNNFNTFATFNIRSYSASPQVVQTKGLGGNYIGSWYSPVIMQDGSIRTFRALTTSDFTQADAPNKINLNLLSLHVGSYNNVNLTSRLNNASIASTSASGNTGSSTDPYVIGKISKPNNSVFCLIGSVSEIINYGFKQETSVENNIAFNINSYYNIYPTDSDANAFVTAAALTNTTQIQAVNKLVTDLKGYGLWGKMKAIYPFVGGTADSHKFNLKDPRDVDGAFRLVFNGGWTHSSSGATSDGTTGYANTYLNPDTALSLNTVHNGFYLRTNNQNINGCAIPQAGYLLVQFISGNTMSSQLNTLAADSFSTNLTPSGFLVANRTSSTVVNGWRNGSKLSTDSKTTFSKPTVDYYIGARNFLGGPVFSTSTGVNQYAFATIGDGLTDTEAANLYTAVQAFQTTLGRQV